MVIRSSPFADINEALTSFRIVGKARAGQFQSDLLICAHIARKIDDIEVVVAEFVLQLIVANVLKHFSHFSTIPVRKRRLTYVTHTTTIITIDRQSIKLDADKNFVKR